MSVTLNNDDFQCLQDQLVDLKIKNYDLAEKNRRSQADFEAAKAKICTLQLKLEEQERDFQNVSATLRREIEYVSNGGDTQSNNESKDNDDYKIKYKKILHKAKELQQRYEKSVEIVEQLDVQNKQLSDRIKESEEDVVKLKKDLASTATELETANKENQAIKEQNDKVSAELEEKLTDIEILINQRDELKITVEELNVQVTSLTAILETEAEERRIQERKGLQVAKELRRQIASEKFKTDTLRSRLENLLKNKEH